MKRNKVFKFLASIKLAVILFVFFVVILASATYYESAYDTPTAQHLVYKSPLFAVFLLIFFVNIFCSTAIRYPWSKKQIGFVVTHLGILVLLAASAFTMVAGVDGSMIIQEGQTSRRIMLNDPVFFVGRPSQRLEEIQAEFRWTPPSENRPQRVTLREGVTAEVVEYLHHARRNTYYKEAPQGVPAVEMRIFNQHVDQHQWLTAGKGDVQLGPARIRLLRANHEEHLKSLIQAGSSERGELQLLVAGEPLQVNVSELSPGKPLQVGDFTVTLRRYLPHAVAVKNELISQSDEPVNPCLDIRLADQKGNSQDWLLFARLPELNTRTASQGEALPAKLLYAFDTAGKDHALSLIVDPAGKLWGKVDAKAATPIEINKPQATGWMNLQFEVSKMLPKAVEVREFVPVEVEKGAEQNAPPPAIRLRLLGTKENQSRWLERGDVISVHADSGAELIVGYAYKSIELAFPVRLKDFQMDMDPGTNSPAAFKSEVEVEGQSYLIQMNEPLVKGGYKFFQSSYSEVPGQPTYSIFTVSKDPGIGLKYLGSIMVVVGIAIMFLTRPYKVNVGKRAVSE
ncbi:MAG: cytochrome c biogenesis protein ResB [Candidatus Eremiobacteraeota bacterium]|nr:cytochrome c biogenesis protein ResB [Candidatus Eremiobacteraeota bacterium]MCW5868159.1 cytochrome c biogenesis protein ResB [Candidatus Eremiobacteraeota bacterium]